MKEIGFKFKGRDAVVICPDEPAKGSPWIWRTEFLRAFNQADLALVGKGFHVAFCSFSDEYGSDEAIALFKEFRDFVVREYSLAPRAALFGFSRGALYAVNYALKHPGDVSLLYLDAPVIDLRSWPGGFGKGCGAPAEWEDCKKRILRISSDAEAENVAINPINNLKRLADTGIPVLLVAGDSDSVVPYEENGRHLADVYADAGREISVIIKPGCDHHPHSLEDVTPIVSFVIEKSKK